MMTFPRKLQIFAHFVRHKPEMLASSQTSFPSNMDGTVRFSRPNMAGTVLFSLEVSVKDGGDTTGLLKRFLQSCCKDYTNYTTTAGLSEHSMFQELD